MKNASDCYRVNALFQRDTKLGLSGMLEHAINLGNPHLSYPTIHVAGSNGKGSVATKIAKGLEKEGCKVGLYTSPHISCFRERIQINSQMIPESDLLRLLPDHLPGSFFEITTLLAFLWFHEQKVDFAVIETGLGGRLDATNIIQPQLAIITSISLEHTEILGSTLADIAHEKGGILKPGSHHLVGKRATFYPHAEQIHGTFSTYDEENSALAKRALEILNVSASSIDFGIAQRPPCRLEKVHERVILDVAHNPDGMKQLALSLKPQKKHVVLGMSKSKDIDASLKELEPLALSFIATEAPSPRSLSASLLAEKIQGYEVKVIPDPFEAVKYALELEGDILVTGTFFIMDAARKALGVV